MKKKSAECRFLRAESLYSVFNNEVRDSHLWIFCFSRISGFPSGPYSERSPHCPRMPALLRYCLRQHPETLCLMLQDARRLEELLRAMQPRYYVITSSHTLLLSCALHNMSNWMYIYLEYKKVSSDNLIWVSNKTRHFMHISISLLFQI